MKDQRYITLLKILDSIRSEAPSSLVRFHSNQTDDIIFSRGKAFIHLFLHVKHGIESFEKRQQLICDDTADGGLDAYFISKPEKKVYLIQSKFKNSATGFVGESISISDLVKMELDRVLAGEKKDSNGVPYNAKVLEFQHNFNEATRKQVFTNKVIFLANLKELNDSQIRKLTNNLDYEVYNFERTYLELVKPLCAATYYDPDKITIELDLSEKTVPQLSQKIKTSYGNCEITAVFIPTKEIARVMAQYKNAILRYNPRNYLGLAKNPVNKEIRKSISSLAHNDFALLNNGLTILADEQEFTVFTGTKNVGRLTLTNPQIINGGQTAYTLSDILERDLATHPQIFDGKEVLVKVVVLKEQTKSSITDKHKFIGDISASTNQQTVLKEADRHSSNPILKIIQEIIYRKYGFLVELKQGEFYYGHEKGFIDKKNVIDRIVMLRASMAFCGQPTPARRQSEPQLFESSFFKDTFTNIPNNIEQLSAEIFYAYKVHSFLVASEKTEGKKSLKYGYALRYGKYAVVYASALLINKDFKKNLDSRSLTEIEQYIDSNITPILNKWKLFESYIQKKPENKTYFNPAEELTDFDTYYKGTNLNKDMGKYFSRTTAKRKVTSPRVK